MNYNRRSTRPDSLFYREQRKLRPSRAAQRIKPVAIAVAAILVAVLAYWLYHR